MAEEILPIKAKRDHWVTLVGLGFIILLALSMGRLFISGEKDAPVVDPSQGYAKQIAQLEEKNKKLEEISNDTKIQLDVLQKKVAALENRPTVAQSSCETARIVVRSNVNNDIVLIDGLSVGQSGEMAHSVCAGTRTIEVTKDGYLDFYQSVLLASGETKTVKARLVRKP